MTDATCHGVRLTDTCGRTPTHVVKINAPTGYKEVEHCEACAEQRLSNTYAVGMHPLEADR